jgi:hypothetical protein
MHGQQHEHRYGREERYERSDDNVARLIVYFGPYFLWAAIGALVGGLFLLG